jgi:hypothetical protein
MATDTRLVPPNEPSGFAYASAAPEEFKQVVATPVAGQPAKGGTLSTLVIENKSGATIYVFAFDGDDSDDPILVPPIPVASHTIVSYDDIFGTHFARGLYIASSSSDAAFAASAAATMWIGVKYTLDRE